MSFLTFHVKNFVICRKTVKSAKNTICDTCALNSLKFVFSDISGHKVVISRKTVK